MSLLVNSYMTSQRNSNLLSAMSTSSGRGSANLSGLLSSVTDAKSSASLMRITYGLSASGRTYGANTANAAKTSDGVSNKSEAALDVKKSAGELSKVLSSLTGGSAFRTPEAVSSDKSVATVTGGRLGASPVSLEVSQLATVQENESAALNAKGQTALSAGNYRFAIESGGKSVDVTFNVKYGETNEAVQRKIADAINAQTSKTGISAAYNYDTKTKTGTLELTGSKTGTDNAFTLTDKTGNAASALGLNTVSSAAQNAVYREGNTSFTSQTNAVTLSNGAKATLLKEGKTDVTVKTGASGATKAVRDMVSAFNDLYSQGNDRLKSQLSSLVSTSATALNRIGISMNTSGKLTVNEDKLNAAASSSTLQNFFSQGSSGFAARLQDRANTVARTPGTYAQDNSAFASLYDPYGLSDAYAGMGTLFNGLF